MFDAASVVCFFPIEALRTDLAGRHDLVRLYCIAQHNSFVRHIFDNLENKQTPPVAFIQENRIRVISGDLNCVCEFGIFGIRMHSFEVKSA